MLRAFAVMRALWRGEIDLPITFWIFGVLIQDLVIWRIGDYIISMSGAPFLVAAYTAFELGCTAFMIVAIWRSAGNYKGRAVWAILARIFCVVNAGAIVLGFVVGLLEE